MNGIEELFSTSYIGMENVGVVLHKAGDLRVVSTIYFNNVLCLLSLKLHFNVHYGKEFSI